MQNYSLVIPKGLTYITLKNFLRMCKDDSLNSYNRTIKYGRTREFERSTAKH